MWQAQNLGYKQILLIQYSVLKGLTTGKPSEKRGVLISCHKAYSFYDFHRHLTAMVRGRGGLGDECSPLIFTPLKAVGKMEAGRGLWSAVIVERCWSQDAAFLLD